MAAPVTPVDADFNIIGGASSPVVTGGNVASGAADSGNPVKAGGVYNLTKPVHDDGDRGNLQLGATGNLQVEIYGAGASSPMNSSAALADGTANNPNRLSIQSFPLKFNGTTWDRDRKANTVGRLPSSAATNNATNLKGSAGDLHHINGHNATAGVKYLKLFNKATAPAPASDTPFLTLALAASTPFKFDFPGGLYFSTGIGYALVTGAADLNDTAVAAGDILGLNITYI